MEETNKKTRKKTVSFFCCGNTEKKKDKRMPDEKEMDQSIK